MKKHYFILLGVFGISFSAMSQAGSPDPSFGNSGIATISLSSLSKDEATSVLIDANGKILLGGTVNIGVNDQDFAVVRLNANGSLDNTFGTGGITTLSLGNAIDEVTDMAIDANGKIVLVGITYQGLVRNVGAARLLANGTIDNTFGTAGKVVLPTTFVEVANAVALDATGKIVIAGMADYADATTSNFFVARLNTNGTLDNTFGSTGKKVIYVSINNNDEANDVKIDGNGNIIVAGRAYDYNNSGQDDMALVRLTSSGALDNSFGTNGVAIINFAGSGDVAESIALDAGNNIYVGGYSNNGTNLDMACAKLTASGNPDNTFGTNGKISLPVGLGDDRAYEIALDANGKIVLAGLSNTGVIGDFAAARLNTNGSADNTFGTNGHVVIAVSPNSDHAWSLAIENSGRIILAGATSVSGYDDFCAVALLDQPNSIIYGVSSENIFLAPNPSLDVLRIPGNLETCKVFDGLGKEVQVERRSNELLINGLAPGRYFIQGEVKGKIITLSFIKG